MRKLTLNVPDRVTRQVKLGLRHNADGTVRRRLRYSGNILKLMGFPATGDWAYRLLGPCAGFEMTPAKRGDGAMKVYERTYNKRANNPLETVFETQDQGLLNSALPSGVEGAHFEFNHGRILVRPAAQPSFFIRRALKEGSGPLEAFVALSSGVDCVSVKRRFALQGLLDYRPVERRDHRYLKMNPVPKGGEPMLGPKCPVFDKFTGEPTYADYTESGVLAAVSNHAFRVVVNEDIYRLDLGRFAEAMKDQPRPALLVISPQCDEFSMLKGKSAKQAAWDSMETTADMWMYCLDIIRILRPACILIENVPGFAAEPSAKVDWDTKQVVSVSRGGPWVDMALRLRRDGYYVNSGIYTATDFGGVSGRTRFLGVCSVWPGFVPPTGSFVPAPGRAWSLIEPLLHTCHPIKEDSITYAQAKDEGRARDITPGTTVAPTLLKSESHSPKDAVRIVTADGKAYLPSEEVMALIQGLGPDFDLGAVTRSIGKEILGQAVDLRMHDAFIDAIYEHISVNCGRACPVPEEKGSGSVAPFGGLVIPTFTPSRQEMQLPLFG